MTTTKNPSVICGVFFALIISATALAPSTRGQDFPEEAAKLRLAQQFERSGLYEKAASLYEELYARNPLNAIYFDALHRVYIQLKEYDRALSLVRQRLDRQPNDLNLLSLLGEDYFKSGKESEAFAAWEQALATNEKDQNVYLHIYNVLMRNRLFGKSADVLLRGRKRLGNDNLFVFELAYAYTILGDFREATGEYLKALKGNPGLLNPVESRMALYTGKPEGLNAAIEATSEEVRKDRRNIVVQRLLAWLYLEGKQFENAYVVYQEIDELSKANGQELLGFANQALKGKALDVSSRAFKHIMERYPESPLQPMAKFGYARSLEEQTALTDSLSFVEGGRLPAEAVSARETLPAFSRVINQYEEIVRSYPRLEYAIQALYQIAFIKFDRLFDIDGALRSLDQIEKEFPTHRMIPSVQLKAGEILLAKGDLTKSAEQFIRVGQSPLASPEERDQALFGLAELDYFQGSFDSALAKLDRLIGNLAADITNDALLLQQFIKEHRTREESLLKDYAHAELLERQRKFSEASALLDQLIGASSSAPIVDDALLKLARLQTKMGSATRALAVYEKLIREHPESILLDRAQLGIGEIYHYILKDKPKAIAAYQELLEKYPNSLFLDEVRKRIRRLRGDAL